MSDLNDSAAPDVEMAEMEVEVEVPTEIAEAAATEAEADVEAEVEGEAEAEADNVAADANATEETAEGDAEEETPKRPTFASYLASPVVTLVVGGGEKEETKERMELMAHKALLVRSPYFVKLCAELGEDRTISLPEQNLDAIGCFLEYLYTGDYFPRKLAGHAHALEDDPTTPAVDETGEQLLKHARVYTLADAFEMPELQTLASSKIHCVQSTAQGEIAYARYVYASTRTDDTTVRHPVAKFWATRSHTLRSEAEKEFQSLCLEYPQFAYDVLTRVLDEKLKRERDPKMHPPSATPSQSGGGRKRARQSSSVQ